MARQPARRLRQPESDEPDHDGADRADQHHPAPAVEAERRRRHQQPGDERHDRHGEELEELVVGERAAAMGQRHQLGDIGIDRDQLDADADAGDEAPQVDAETGGLERHDRGGDRVPDQREREDGSPAVLVGDVAKEDRADEQAGEQREHERADAGDADGGPRMLKTPSESGGEVARLVQPGSDVGGQEQVIHLEAAAERDQCDQYQMCLVIGSRSSRAASSAAGVAIRFFLFPVVRLWPNRSARKPIESACQPCVKSCAALWSRPDYRRTARRGGIIQTCCRRACNDCSLVRPSAARTPRQAAHATATLRRSS